MQKNNKKLTVKILASQIGLLMHLEYFNSY